MRVPVIGPALPWPGLLATLASYSGKGQLFSALAAVQNSDDDWSAVDVRRRARRILLEQVTATVLRLPETASTWIEALPAQSRRERAVSGAPRGSVDWPRTRLAGWPPQHYMTTNRLRQADELLVTSLAWTARRLLDVVREAAIVLPELRDPIARQLVAIDKVLALSPVREAEQVVPGRPELSALRSSGRPWSALARTAEILLSEDTDLDTLARQLLLPDDEIRWRLFHLGCLGTVIAALKARGWKVVSRRPLGKFSEGPSYVLKDSVGAAWDLWFEAAGIWKFYNTPSPYVEATRALAGVGQPLGADLALIRHGKFAVAIECKYSDDPTYIARQGYLQAVTYLTELNSRIANECSAVVVGPEGIVKSRSTTTISSGRLSLVPPSELPALLPGPT